MTCKIACKVFALHCQSIFNLLKCISAIMVYHIHNLLRNSTSAVAAFGFAFSNPIFPFNERDIFLFHAYKLLLKYLLKISEYE